jgi:hypothetical protein
MKTSRSLSMGAVIAFVFLGSSAASASDAEDVKAAIGKWVADFNRGDIGSFVAACAPRAAVVDGFPPYAWQSCKEWMADYESNNKALQATHGTLEIGKPIYEELTARNAYMIYPATFTDTQRGKQVIYKGTWTMTLQKTKRGWIFTGSASAWGGNSL